jgi:hypothetical protein
MGGWFHVQGTAHDWISPGAILEFCILTSQCLILEAGYLQEEHLFCVYHLFPSLLWHAIFEEQGAWDG